MKEASFQTRALTSPTCYTRLNEISIVLSVSVLIVSEKITDPSFVSHNPMLFKLIKKHLENHKSFQRVSIEIKYYVV